jgi:hypothetical protein
VKALASKDSGCEGQSILNFVPVINLASCFVLKEAIQFTDKKLKIPTSNSVFPHYQPEKVFSLMFFGLSI